MSMNKIKDILATAKTISFYIIGGITVALLAIGMILLPFVMIGLAVLFVDWAGTELFVRKLIPFDVDLKLAVIITVALFFVKSMFSISINKQTITKTST